MIIFRHIPYVYLTIITVSAYLHELKHEHDRRPYYISLPSSVTLSVSILLYVLQGMLRAAWVYQYIRLWHISMVLCVPCVGEGLTDARAE